ncbi:hypothetical protein PDTK01_37920 [Phycicoccus sp. DTK01]|nr:hypothetical protein PDTK01_37920 [Phycicoccus sp. DTK01]
MSADGPASAEAVKHVLAAWAIAPPDDERTDALVTHTLEEHLKNTATGSRFAGRLAPTIDTVASAREKGTTVNRTVAATRGPAPVVQLTLPAPASANGTRPRSVGSTRTVRDGVPRVLALGPLDDRGRVNAAKPMSALGWSADTELYAIELGQGLVVRPGTSAHPGAQPATSDGKRLRLPVPSRAALRVEAGDDVMVIAVPGRDEAYVVSGSDIAQALCDPTPDQPALSA